MKQDEELFIAAKQQIEQIEIPADLEDRLRAKLENTISRPAQRSRIRSGIMRGIAAALILLVVLAGYNFNTLAFYAKRIIGYDSLMTENLKELNKQGKGQQINQSYRFKNGVLLTVDGIMLDDNRLMMFYSLSAKGIEPSKLEMLNLSGMHLSGMFDNQFVHGGYGSVNKNKGIIKWVMDFPAPFFLDRKLNFHFFLSDGSINEAGSLNFTLDRSKAMGHTLKKTLHTSISVSGSNIHFKSIMASATMTVVKGSIQNIFQLGLSQLLGERIRPGTLEIKLLADGKELNALGSSMGTDERGITFEDSYEPLPEQFHTLQLKVVRFSADHDVKKVIPVNEGMNSTEVSLLGQRIEIQRVWISEGKTYITVSSTEDVILTRVRLNADQRTLKLEKTIDTKQNKSTAGQIIKTRTLMFDGSGKEMELNIQRMTYGMVCNKVIDIVHK